MSLQSSQRNKYGMKKNMKVHVHHAPTGSFPCLASLEESCDY